MACSNCKLVSYCSVECQRTHWSIHKRDCKNDMMRSDWKPTWERENRLPAFMREDGDEAVDPLDMGLHLWGNMPAVDLINLDKNESNHSVDLSLVCVASGDLRNVVRTVNELPDDYNGQLTILLNDRDPFVTVRNLVLLFLLGTIDDEVLATDLALHYWYSVFLPVEYHLNIMMTMRPLVEKLASYPPGRSFALGNHSELVYDVPCSAIDLMLVTFKRTYDMDDAFSEYIRVRFAPRRRDYHDRAYCVLEPAHRVAVQEFRRLGVVLPFGAVHRHFNFPNRSLFSPEGNWLQNDYASPLECWDLKSVIEAGKNHGAQRADLFGCLYFFLTDQLRIFSRRIRQFKVKFHVFNNGASDLAENLNAGTLTRSGIPASMRFDRIDVSDIMDIEYVGIQRVLENWSPLLRRNGNSTIIAYFMNWRNHQKGGDPLSAGQHVVRTLMRRLQDSNRVFLILHLNGTYTVLKTLKLRMKELHTIVPHRNFAPLDGSPNALPIFPYQESWYLNVYLEGLAWSERYVEFSRERDT
ncbi:hypothetical protein NEOLEDRAFT_1163492 [Neolentinus lepideus HHB14362 ss-1]|uniref:MYND-type domain-containing protein n=1 Tax=Neolentinus lepideus HHB14362 ss-1 TaxID=1314782 RepID=A0A165RJN8_9AGAM|nr:hypothetical protein NEOLEDRAFT_1163492 [Neolentinus lepideus HHB14362 ss-1]